MEFLVMASKLMAMLGGFSILFSFQPQVSLMPPQITVESEQLTVKTKLLNAFPEELDEIFLSGTPVTLKFKVNLRDRNGLIEEKELFHTVIYDLSKREYIVIISYQPSSKTTTDILEMKKWFGELNANLVPKEKILPEKLYIIEIAACLLPIKIKPLKMKFDLMTFWEYKIPKVTSQFALKE